MDLFRKKAPYQELGSEVRLVPCLSAFDLIFMGIGAIIGAGIFILTGIVSATYAGPAVILSYLVAGIACTFAALSYAELATSIGGCGSAYGYAYVGFGELLAWIVGWDLLLEYAISVSAVSVGWSAYLNDVLRASSLHLPSYLLQGPLSGGLINLLAFAIIAFITILLILGVKTSARFNNLMVTVKLLVIVLFIVIASREVRLENWASFMPFGWSGVMKGAALIFFAYVGFDAVSTTAEEALHPQQDLPKGILGSLIICTILYIIVSGLLTGMAYYSSLNNSSPISHSLLKLGYKTASGLIGLGALAGLTTVILVLYYGLTRIFLAMARDGLLPQFFAKTNAYTQTPIRIILLCGLLTGALSAFIPLTDLAELVNIGTLFAFMIVCAGVLYLRYTKPELPRPFKISGMPYVPLLGILSCFYLILHLSGLTWIRFFIWMLLGFIFYFSFSQKHSKLNRNAPDTGRS